MLLISLSTTNCIESKHNGGGIRKKENVCFCLFQVICHLTHLFYSNPKQNEYALLNISPT